MDSVRLAEKEKNKLKQMQIDNMNQMQIDNMNDFKCHLTKKSYVRDEEDD